jgi:hypothetical protein
MRPEVIPVTEAVAMIPDGARLMIGGFMGDASLVRPRMSDEELTKSKCNLRARDVRFGDIESQETHSRG